ncbi:MAG TPA: phosphatidylinositol mannoside acyltransferase [Jatrophihabitans sp.]|nr:phosphatidylinositol mannoside acyltransferase [Jatrophihabitans sp.]
MSALPDGLGRLRGQLGAVGYLAGWRGVRALPEPVAARLFGGAGELVARRDAGGVRQLRANLHRVTGRSGPELDELVRAGMRSYARYWMETFRLPSMDVARTLARARTDGWEHVQAGLDAGRGVVVALPHSGNWDVAGLWLVQQGYRFTTVVERLDPAALFDRFVAYRESLGMRVLPLTGGERPVTEVLTERLRAGEVVCLVADRDLSRTGIEVDFFGEPARMPAGPAVLAATTGAALLPVHTYYLPDGWGQWVGPPVELGAGRLREKVRRATQQLADTFAGRIAAHPADWHMLQKLWLADLDPARLAPDEALPPAGTG